MRIIERLELGIRWLREHADGERAEGNQECGGETHRKR